MKRAKRPRRLNLCTGNNFSMRLVKLADRVGVFTRQTGQKICLFKGIGCTLACNGIQPEVIKVQSEKSRFHLQNIKCMHVKILRNQARSKTLFFGFVYFGATFAPYFTTDEAFAVSRVKRRVLRSYFGVHVY